MSQKTSLMITEDLKKEITSRGEQSYVIRRDLERLYALYRRSLARISLTKNEALLIADALNGALFDNTTVFYFWASIEDAIKLEGLDKKWQVDGKKLVDKLRSLSDAETLALVDAVERFWQASTRGENKSLEEFLRQAIKE